MPLRVPVMLLVLEHDWVIVRQLGLGTLYGCPRLVFGPQVAFAHVFDHSSAHCHRHAPDCVDDAAVLMVGDYWHCQSTFTDAKDVWFLVLGIIAKHQCNWEVCCQAQRILLSFLLLRHRHTLLHSTIQTCPCQFPHTTVSELASVLLRRLSRPCLDELSHISNGTTTWTHYALEFTYVYASTLRHLGKLPQCNIQIWIASLCIRSSHY